MKNVRMYVCAYVRMCVCAWYVCTCVRTYVRMYVCIYVCMYACMYLCMHARTHACTHECTHAGYFSGLKGAKGHSDFSIPHSLCASVEGIEGDGCSRWSEGGDGGEWMMAVPRTTVPTVAVY